MSRLPSPAADSERTSTPVHVLTVPLAFAGLLIGFLLGYIVGPWGAVAVLVLAAAAIGLSAARPQLRSPLLMGLASMVVAYLAIMLVALLNM